MKKCNEREIWRFRDLERRGWIRRNRQREREGEEEDVKSVVSLCRCKLTGKLACVDNGAKSNQALAGTLSLRQTGSLLTQSLPLSLDFEKKKKNTDINTVLL